MLDLQSTIGFAGIKSLANNLLGKNINVPDIPSQLVEAPSSSAKIPSSYSEYSSSDDYYNQYLDLVEKASQAGVTSTAADAANQAQLDRMFQSLEAQKERDWYKEMSDTAYQRQMNDLKAAGLNPILGFANFGSGASTAHAAVPTGSTGQIRATASNLADYINAGANLISSAGKLLSGIGVLKKFL